MSKESLRVAVRKDSLRGALAAADLAEAIATLGADIAGLEHNAALTVADAHYYEISDEWAAAQAAAYRARAAALTRARDWICARAVYFGDPAGAGRRPVQT